MNPTTPQVSVHPSIILRPCDECGEPFASQPFVLQGRLIHPQRYCESCLARHEQAQAREREEREAARLQEAWERLCPPIYRDTDPLRLPCSRGVRETVLGWHYGPKGLLLHGPTSSGKSRLVYLLLSRLHHIEHRKIAAMTSTTFSHQIATLFGEGSGRGEAFIGRLADIEVLFLDDIGKGRFTDRVEAEFFHVIEQRCANLLPTLLTTNLTGEALRSTWSPDRAQPLVRRLREFFLAVPVLPETPASKSEVPQ
ncbi:MAG TPA: hypothetical protein PKM73_20405 [Verrucomicrobiota bacterium]|nr:hypothetical protein [Verrucomicrobiota bacterium]